jgi:hypothetical protein
MFDINELKNKIAVIAIGNTPYGTVLHIDDYGLAAQAFGNAAADCGIDKNKIDGASRLPHPVLRANGRNPWAQAALDDDPARSRPHVGNGDHRGIGGDRRRPRRIRVARCRHIRPRPRTGRFRPHGAICSRQAACLK